MTHKLHPVIDQWYWHRDKGQTFFVVAIDERRKTIEIQHFDGNIEEFSFDEWHSMDIETGEEPENWTGALDIGARDDLGTGVTDTSREDWQSPQIEVHSADELAAGEGPLTGTDRPPAGAGNDGASYGEGRGESDLQEDMPDDLPPQGRTGPANPAAEGLIRRPDGVLEETLGPPWYAEYAEDADTGLWRVRVYKRDVPEWTNTGFESLDEARQAAMDYYDQV